MPCYRCYANMIEVIIVNTWGRERKAIVCTECGRISSKEKLIINVGGKYGRK